MDKRKGDLIDGLIKARLETISPQSAPRGERRAAPRRRRRRRLFVPAHSFVRPAGSV